MIDNVRITDEEAEQYCKKYLETFSRTEAYKAVHPDCTHESAVANGLRYYNYPKIRDYLTVMMQDKLMSTDEIFKLLSDRARDNSNKQAQLKALELIGRTKGIFLDRTDITTAGTKISWNQFINSEGEVKKDYKGGTVLFEDKP
jgi:antitoxin component YwqK of YwqJK toxin-antitoxin module